MIDFVQAISESHSLDDVWAIHCRTLEGFGFDRLVYGYSNFMGPTTVAPKEDTLFLSSHDPEYTKIYIDKELYRNGPMTNWATENNGAESWRWIQDNMDSLSDEQRSVVQLNHDMGVIAGYTQAFPSNSYRARGILGMTARRGLTQDDVDLVWEKHGELIACMNTVLHLKIMSLPHDTHRSKLTDRQREVLQWVGDGKTNQDVAVILGLSAATIEKHLRIARDKLGVDTTAQAVLKMSLLNQIHKI